MNLGRLIRHHPRVAITSTACAIAFVAGWTATPPSALAAGGSMRLFAALGASGLVALFCGPLHAVRGPRQRRAALTVAAITLALGLVAFVVSSSVEQRCTATYASQSVVIGTAVTEWTVAYQRLNPGLSNDDLIFDAAGDAARVWTASSIARCRTLLRGTYFLWIPCLLGCLAATAHALAFGGLTTLPSRLPASRPHQEAAPRIRYDVFISYRHGPPDSDVARELDERLRAFGYTVAIDERDFAANAHFLTEMERAIRESRFTVAIVSARYLNSGNCEEEAVVCKVLDMGDRKRRLVPFILEEVPLPVWLYSIVGVDSTKRNALVEPLDRLRATLGEPLTRV
jgi:hypothetical protein